MFGRRVWILSAIAAGVALVFGKRSSAQIGNSSNAAERLDDSRVVNLEDQLKNGLRVVTADQLKFVKIVVAYVEQGRMPRAMVNVVYTWALERNPSVPFPYFQFALRALARRHGIKLP